MVLLKREGVGCDVIRLHGTRRPSRADIASVRHRVIRCGVKGNMGRAGEQEVGVMVKELTVNKVTWTHFMAVISERLMSMTFNVGDNLNAVAFAVAYAAVDTARSRDNWDILWTELDSITKRVLTNDHLAVLMKTNGRTVVKTG